MDTANGPTDRGAREQILVAVKDEGEGSGAHGSLIDDVEKAKRVVEALVEAGVEPEAVSALRAREVPLKVSYRWDVELTEKGAAAGRASQRATRRSDAGGAALLARLIEFLEDATPQKPFQLRLDRVAWLSLWAISLLILGISVLASMSKGSAREFIIDAPPSSFEGSESQTEEGSVLSSPPAEDVSPAVGDAAEVPQCAQGPLEDCQCQDFQTQGEAQAFFEAHPPGPGHSVDPDGDGVLCEWVPLYTPPPGQ
ncbi:MAG TPA: hypothetical protein VGR43_11465 [Dehalococcoidia bacterium]|nr:hypothetical protein [Dehalococcoidia bacterium]